MLYLVATVGVLAAGCLAGDAPGWSYIAGSDNGPEQWPELFESCSGSFNSPIDINQVSIRPAPVWKFDKWNEVKVWSIANKKSTVKFTLESSPGLTTAGGMLPMEYDVAQFHFHWGKGNTKGSEHTIQGISYPLEMHVVHKKSDYKTLLEAVESGEDDALAAVGFFFTISEEDNPRLEKLIEGVRLVKDADVDEYKFGSLDEVTLYAKSSHFYRYMGGLTTPGCNEQVVWTVFQTPISISRKQLAAFRDLDTGDYGTELYRPVVPQGNRTVIQYTVMSPRVRPALQLLGIGSASSQYPCIISLLLCSLLALFHNRN